MFAAILRLDPEADFRCDLALLEAGGTEPRLEELSQAVQDRTDRTCRGADEIDILRVAERLREVQFVEGGSAPESELRCEELIAENFHEGARDDEVLLDLPLLGPTVPSGSIRRCSGSGSLIDFRKPAHDDPPSLIPFDGVGCEERIPGLRPIELGPRRFAPRRQHLVHLLGDAAPVEDVEHVAQTLHDRFLEPEGQERELIAVDLGAEVGEDGGDVVDARRPLAVAQEVERGQRGGGDLHPSGIGLDVFDPVHDRGHLLSVVEDDEVASRANSGHALVCHDLELHDGPDGLHRAVPRL